MNAVYGEDIGQKLIRPKSYKGTLYAKVTGLRKAYLKALGEIGTGNFVEAELDKS